MTFVQYLAEARSKTLYGCVMLRANISKWKSQHLSLIDKQDVFEQEGLETIPHVTVLYGVHEDTANPEAVLRLIGQIKPVTVSVNNISIFENDEFDVVKYTIPKDRSLIKLRNQLMSTFKNTQTFPDYQPHMTIGYVCKGTGSQYVGKVASFDVTFNVGVYSFHTDPKDKESREQITVNL